MPICVNKWNLNKDLVKTELDKLNVKMLPRDYTVMYKGKEYPIGRWIETQLSEYKKGTLLPFREKALEEIGLNLNETKIKFFVKTSFPEQALAYYLSQNERELGKVHSNDLSKGFDLDIILPSKGIIIEYDGNHFHNSEKQIEEDTKRTESLYFEGYDVIRIREEGLPFIEGCHNIARVDNSSDYYENTDKMIKDVVRYLNKEYDFNIDIDKIDSKKDCSDIYLRYKAVRDAEFEEFKAALKTYTAGDTTKKGKERTLAYMPSNYKDSLGFPLGAVCKRYRDYAKRDILPSKQIKDLKAIGFVFNPNEIKIKDIQYNLNEIKKINPSFEVIPNIYATNKKLEKEEKLLLKDIDKLRREYSKGNLSEKAVKMLSNINIDISKEIPVENKILYDIKAFWKEIEKTPSKIEGIKNIHTLVDVLGDKHIATPRDFYTFAVSKNHRAIEHIPEQYKESVEIQNIAKSRMKNYIEEFVKKQNDGKISVKNAEEIKSSFNKEEKELYEKMTSRTVELTAPKGMKI